MKKIHYHLIENYMLSCMKDSAHDQEHIYRVLYLALDIAQTEPDTDYDVLICACLLHDIGRQAQFDDPSIDHAEAGADQAFRFLMEQKFPEDFAGKVSACIRSHRFRKNNPPKSIEAKILFDADKIDISGAIGIARTLIYQGQVGEPLYHLLPDGTVSNGTDHLGDSFLREYKYKLEQIYEHFYTDRGRTLARSRQRAAADFYKNLFREIADTRQGGNEQLHLHLE